MSKLKAFLILIGFSLLAALGGALAYAQALKLMPLNDGPLMAAACLTPFAMIAFLVIWKVLSLEAKEARRA